MRVDHEALVNCVGTLSSAELDRGLTLAVRQLLDLANGLLGADGAGLMLVDRDGRLRCAAASGQPAQLAEADQERLRYGPGAAAFELRAPVTVRIGTAERPGTLASVPLGAPFHAALSVPVQIRGRPVGALDVYATSPRAWDNGAVSVAQACAEVLANLLGATLTAREHGRLVRQTHADGPDTPEKPADR